MKENTKHEYLDDLIRLLSDTNKDRNRAIKNEEDKFDEEYIKKLHENYRRIVNLGYEVNDKSSMVENPFKKEEYSLLEDLSKFLSLFLRWI